MVRYFILSLFISISFHVLGQNNIPNAGLISSKGNNPNSNYTLQTPSGNKSMVKLKPTKKGGNRFYSTYSDSENVQKQSIIDELTKKGNNKIATNGDSLSAVAVTVDQLGFTHNKYQQYYNGIPIDGSVFSIHEKNEKVRRVSGTFFENITVDIQPQLSGFDAFNIAVGIINNNDTNYNEPVLVIAPMNGDYSQKDFRLSYKFNKGGLVVFIDAHSGELVNKFPTIHNVSVTGTATTMYSGVQDITVDYSSGIYSLRDDTRGIYVYDGTNDSEWQSGNPPANPSDIYDDDNVWDRYSYLAEITISSVSDAWYTYITDEEPDLYLEIFDSGNNLIFTSDVIMNANPDIHFYDINLPLDAGTYRVNVMDEDNSSADDFCGSFSINVQDGQFLFNESDVAGSYTIYGSTNNIAADIIWGLEQTYDYYSQVMGRNSFDGAGKDIEAWINPNTLPDWDDNNAFAAHYWDNGTTYDYMCFGLGDRSYMNPVVSLDVIAHEFTHMVTSYTSGLYYQAESGALNEALSDIMASVIDYHVSGPGTHWTIGEGIMNYTPFMRSLSNPKSSDLIYEYNYYGTTQIFDDRLPNTYQGEFWMNPNDLSRDYGGVHQNCGVVNYWFYLLSDGGAGINDRDMEYSVNGIGIENAAQVVYRAMTEYLTPISEFGDAYNATLLAAEDLFGPDSDEWWAVKNAWYAVGVIYTDPNAFCSSQVQLTEPNGVFDDGSGSANYANFSSCQWLIAPPGATSITLEFTEFDVENYYDSVIVYASIYNNPNYAIVIWYGNTLPPEPITINGGAALVEFRSDATQTAGGWEISYTSTSVPTCDGYTLMTENTGTLSDNSEAIEQYGNNQNCEWIIAPPGAETIELLFSRFDTELDYDGLMIFDGEPDWNGLSNLIDFYTGTYIPDPAIAYSGEMWVYFTSDPYVTGLGFEATYTTVASPYCEGVQVLTEDTGIIADGSDANTYYHNSDCGWLIQPQGALSVSFSFIEFNLEPAEDDGRTYYDYVEVFDGVDASAPSLGKFAGNTLPPTITSTGGAMFVQFESDLRLEYTGFVAEYEITTDNYCPDLDVYTDSSAVINDGSYELPYGNNTECMTLIQPDGAASVVLKFSEFDIETDNDILLVYDGTDTSSNLIITLTGHYIPDSIVSPTGTILLWFLTNNANRYNGWTAEYYATDSVFEVDQSLELSAGWNFISLNVSPSDKSVESVFANILANAAIIKSDAGFYYPNVPSQLNSLHIIRDGAAYLVYMNDADTLNVRGLMINANALNIPDSMSEGWNYIGCPFSNPTPFSELFDLNRILIIKDFDGFYEPMGTQNSIEQLEPGKGYFVKYE